MSEDYPGKWFEDFMLGFHPSYNEWKRKGLIDKEQKQKQKMKEQKCVEISLTLRGESKQVDITVQQLKEVVRKCGIETYWEKETHWKMDYSIKNK